MPRTRRRSRSRSRSCKTYQYRSPRTGHCKNIRREALIAKAIAIRRRRRSRSRRH